MLLPGACYKLCRLCACGGRIYKKVCCARDSLGKNMCSHDSFDQAVLTQLCKETAVSYRGLLDTPQDKLSELLLFLLAVMCETDISFPFSSLCETLRLSKFVAPHPWDTKAGTKWRSRMRLCQGWEAGGIIWQTNYTWPEVVCYHTYSSWRGPLIILH